MTRRARILGCCVLLALGGCHDAPASTDTDTGDSSTTASTSTGGSDASATTSEASTSPTTTSGGTDATSTGTDGSNSTSSTDPAPTSTGDSTSTSDTSGGNEVCERWIVHEGDLWITDDTDLATLVCIVEVTGSLHVEGTSLTSFSPLSHLATVGHDVVVLDNPALVDLAGLAGLETVEGDIHSTLAIHDNPALVDISGLASLAVVDSLSIRNCDALTDLTGPQGPIVGSEAKAWYLGLADNDSLTDLAGLAAIQDFSGRLGLDNNLALTDISALSSALDPAGLDGIYIVDNPALLSLAGLEAVSRVGELQLFNNDALTSMHGLEGLIESTNDMYIVDHDNLATLQGLEALEEVVSLQLSGNPSLAALEGLNGLTTATLGLAIGTCDGGGSDVLVDLHGLENLQTAGSLGIANNAALTSLAGLEGLQSLDFLGIQNNTALPTADAQAFAAKFVNANVYLCNNKGAPEMCPC